MKYVDLTITTTTEAADLVADVLFSLGAGGVSIDDVNDVKDALASSQYWDYVEDGLLEERNDVYVKTLVAEDALGEFLSSLVDELSALSENSEIDLGKLDVNTKPSNDVNWQEEWKKFFKPIVTKRITVVPAWQQYEPRDGEVTMLIEAGSAFGTGEHETTQMCLELMPEVEGKSVVDVGCGSGILGIAAKLLGASSVYACDIDSSAIVAAKNNAELNSVELTAERADLLETDKKADVIFANITADILIRLSKMILNHANKMCKVVLSGIIHSRLAEVQQAFEAVGLRVVSHLALGEWDALLLEY